MLGSASGAVERAISIAGQTTTDVAFGQTVERQTERARPAGTASPPGSIHIATNEPGLRWDVTAFDAAGIGMNTRFRWRSIASAATAKRSRRCSALETRRGIARWTQLNVLNRPKWQGTG